MYTDEYILDLLKKDPDKAASLLVGQYSSLLGSICARKLQNPEDIRECVNDTFAEFLLNPGRYTKSKGSIKKYLCSIAEHKAVDRFRQNHRRANLEKELMEKHKEDHHRKLSHDEETEQLNAAMDKLPPLDRQILEMHYYDDLSYKEISKELNLSYENVRKRGLRGKKKLIYFILLGILILGITACTTVVMKKQGWLPKWFPFYDIIPGDAPDSDFNRPSEQPLKIIPNNMKDIDANDLRKEISDESSQNLPTSDTQTSSKTYYYSVRNGLVSVDSPAYELIKSSQVYERNGVTYELIDGFYQDGKIEVSLLLTCTDESRLSSITLAPDVPEEEWMGLLTTLPENWDQQEMSYLYKNDVYFLSQYDEKIPAHIDSGNKSIQNGEPTYNKAVYHCDFSGVGTLTQDGEDYINVSLHIGNDYIFHLIFEKMELKEYMTDENKVSDKTEASDESEAESNISESSDIVALDTGICVTQDGTAVVELYAESLKDYRLANLLTQSYLGLIGRETLVPSLVDAEGDIYERFRSSKEMAETDDESKNLFKLYFHNVEPGEYTLKIPCLCMEKDLKTETVTLPLPTDEDTYLECDHTILFPDGAGFHITGIERTGEVDTSYSVNHDGTVTIVYIPVWYYSLTYETISPDDSEDGVSFYLASVTGTASNGANVSCSINPWYGKEDYCLRISSEDMPESLDVAFHTPTYYLDKEYSFDITIQE